MYIWVLPLDNTLRLVFSYFKLKNQLLFLANLDIIEEGFYAAGTGNVLNYT